MKKKLSLIMAAALAVSAMSIGVNGEDLSDTITLTAFGQEVECDQPPIIFDGRTLIPLRAAAEAVGAEVNWDNDEKAAIVENSDLQIKLVIGENKVSVKDNATGEVTDTEIDVPAQVVNDRTMVPVRIIAETLNLNVDWDSDTKTVAISLKDDSDKAEETTAEQISEETTDTVVEDSTETTTAQVKVIKAGADYSKNAEGKIVATDKVTVDDKDLLTIKIKYDEIAGNTAYNNYMKETAEKDIADYIRRFEKEVKDKYQKELDDLEGKTKFVPYDMTVTYEVTYSSADVISTMRTPEEHVGTSYNTTHITTRVTDSTGANLLELKDLIDPADPEDAYALAIEKFNKRIADSTNYLMTTSRRIRFFDFAVEGKITSDNLDFYLDSNGNYVFYADRGVIAPYEHGIISVSVTGLEIERTIKIG